jgi:hypothetical protein
MSYVFIFQHCNTGNCHGAERGTSVTALFFNMVTLVTLVTVERYHRSNAHTGVHMTHAFSYRVCTKVVLHSVTSVTSLISLELLCRGAVLPLLPH